MKKKAVSSIDPIVGNTTDWHTHWQVLGVAIGLYNDSSTNVLRNLNVFFIFTQLWYIFMNRPSKLREMLDKFVFWIVTEFQGVVYASAVSPVFSTQQCLDLAQLALNWRRSRAMARTRSLKGREHLIINGKTWYENINKRMYLCIIHTYYIHNLDTCILYKMAEQHRAMHGAAPLRRAEDRFHL